ncbi:hypothetical protein ACOME3_002602 [Neoechinorhynchus agilis]
MLQELESILLKYNHLLRSSPQISDLINQLDARSLPEFDDALSYIQSSDNCLHSLLVIVYHAIGPESSSYSTKTEQANSILCSLMDFNLIQHFPIGVFDRVPFKTTNLSIDLSRLSSHDFAVLVYFIFVRLGKFGQKTHQGLLPKACIIFSSILLRLGQIEDAGKTIAVFHAFSYRTFVDELRAFLISAKIAIFRNDSKSAETALKVIKMAFENNTRLIEEHPFLFDCYVDLTARFFYNEQFYIRAGMEYLELAQRNSVVCLVDLKVNVIFEKGFADKLDKECYGLLKNFFVPRLIPFDHIEIMYRFWENTSNYIDDKTLSVPKEELQRVLRFHNLSCISRMHRNISSKNLRLVLGIGEDDLNQVLDFVREAISVDAVEARICDLTSFVYFESKDEEENSVPSYVSDILYLLTGFTL